jgi:hypothetical protein
MLYKHTPFVTMLGFFVYLLAKQALENVGQENGIVQTI